jgi:hypothetical protein
MRKVKTGRSVSWMSTELPPIKEMSTFKEMMGGTLRIQIWENDVKQEGHLLPNITKREDTATTTTTTTAERQGGIHHPEGEEGSMPPPEEEGSVPEGGLGGGDSAAVVVPEKRPVLLGECWVPLSKLHRESTLQDDGGGGGGGGRGFKAAAALEPPGSMPVIDEASCSSLTGDHVPNEQDRETEFQEELWLLGRPIGNLTGVALFVTPPHLTQMVSGVLTEKGILSSVVLVTDMTGDTNLRKNVFGIMKVWCIYLVSRLSRTSTV